MTQPEASPSNNADAGRGLSEGLGHGARYAEWRDFYGLRVTGWMRLEQLRIECARLQDAGNTPSPELLLVHAMHELERLRAPLADLVAALDAQTGDLGDCVARSREAMLARAIAAARDALRA